MDKKLFLLGISGIFLLLFALNTVSAYHNFGDYIDSSSYSSSRSYGYADHLYTRTTDYHRDTISRYLSDGTYEKTITYVKTTRESPPNYNYRYYNSRPNYGGAYWLGNYDRSRYGGYGNYYGGQGYRFGNYYNNVPDWRR